MFGPPRELKLPRPRFGAGPPRNLGPGGPPLPRGLGSGLAIIDGISPLFLLKGGLLLGRRCVCSGC